MPLPSVTMRRAPAEPPLKPFARLAVVLASVAALGACSGAPPATPPATPPAATAEVVAAVLRLVDEGEGDFARFRDGADATLSVGELAGAVACAGISCTYALEPAAVADPAGRPGAALVDVPAVAEAIRAARPAWKVELDAAAAGRETARVATCGESRPREIRVARRRVTVETGLSFAAGVCPGERPGLGFAFLPREDGLFVQATAPGHPAADVLRPADVVTSVAGREMGGLSRIEIFTWLREVVAKGAPATLQILRDGPVATVQQEVVVTPEPYSRDALRRLVEALPDELRDPPPLGE